MDIKLLGPGDGREVESAAHLFDGAALAQATDRFLGSADHHILVAYEHGHAIGFATGVEMTHPDKGTEMFLYELSVEERFRRRGVGRALVTRLAELARAQGCYGMWVLTDEDNDAAQATYGGAGGIPERGQVLFSWTF